MSDVFKTHPENAIVHASGWFEIVPGIEIVKIPLLDATAKLPDGRPMFARVSHEDEEAVCERLGAEFVTMDLAKRAWQKGVKLRPVTLVRTAADQHAMRGRAFCETHDTRVWNQLESIPWDGELPVGSIGKFWLRPTSSNARNGGWFKPDGSPIQPGGSGSEHHERTYTDYSQLCYIMRRVGNGPFAKAANWLLRRFV